MEGLKSQFLQRIFIEKLEVPNEVTNHSMSVIYDILPYFNMGYHILRHILSTAGILQSFCTQIQKFVDLDTL